MPNPAAHLNVVVTVNSRQAVRGLRQVDQVTRSSAAQANRSAKAQQRHSKALRGIGRGAAYALGAGGFGGGLYALFDITKKSITEFREAQRVHRQTVAVLNSTGHAANVSVKGVERLTNAMKWKTGIDDEAIQSGANMILTFRNIRNEAGKGNKIFDQTVVAATDMSAAFTAMGKSMSISDAALQIGKAMNDPIKGMTKLQRMGVTFSQGQIDQAKHLTETGHRMEAQKIILRELTKEFGGSAKAHRTETKLLQAALGDLAEMAGKHLAPVLEKAAHGLRVFVQQMATGKGAGGAMLKFFSDLSRHLEQIGKSLGMSKVDWQAFGKAVANVWTVLGPTIGRHIKGVMQLFQGWAQMLGGVIKVITGILTLDFARAWEGVKQIFRGAFNVIVGQLRILTGPLRQVITMLAGAMKGPFVAVWAFIKNLFVTGFNAIRAVIMAATGPQRQAIAAIANALSGPFRTAWNIVKTLFRAGFAAVKTIITTYIAIVRAAVRAVASVISGPFRAVWNTIRAVFRAGVGFIAAHLRRQIGLIRGLASAIGRALSGPLRAAWNVVSGLFRSGVRRAQTIYGSLAGAVKRGSGVIVRALTGPIRAGWETLKTLFRSGSKAAGGTVHALGKGIRRIVGAIQRVFGKLGETIKNIAGFISKAINKVVKAIGKMKDKVSDMKPSLPNLPNLPGIPGIQRGGPIDQGKANGDSVPAMLEKGEYVLNRKAVRKVGKRKLDAVNFGDAPRFQHGGAVGMAEGGWAGIPPNGLHSGAKKVALFAMKKYGAAASSTFRAGDPGHHGRHEAVDLTSGNMKAMGLGIDRRYRSSLEELIHTPMGFSVSAGKRVAPYAQADHFDHVHEAVLAGTRVKGGAFGGGTQIPRFKIKGQGFLADIARGAGERMRGVANRYLDRIAPSTSSDIPEFSGKWTEVMAKIAKSKNWSLGDWKTLVGKESGGNPNARNPSSGAYGLGQFLGATARAYAKYGALSSNPVEQIHAMAKYIADRYGNPSKALAFHRANNWYRTGGMVGMATGGAVAPPAAKPGKPAPKTGMPKMGQGASNKTIRTILQDASGLFLKGHPRKAGDKISAGVKKIKELGLTAKATPYLDKLRLEADTFGEYADRAQGEEGKPGSFGGVGEGGWLNQQLQKLFALRTAILHAQAIIAARRKQIEQLTKWAKRHLKALTAWKKRVDKQVKGYKKIKKPNKAQKKRTKTAKDLSKRLGRGIGAFKGKVIPSLNTRGGELAERGTELGADLVTVQGLGQPLGGVYGGDIGSVQDRLRELSIKPTPDTAESPKTEAINELLREQLRQSNLRTAVSEAAFDVFKDMPYAGSFQTGPGQWRQVPGPMNRPQMATVHGGEMVGRPGDTQVQVFVHPGGTGADVKVNGEWVRAEVKKTLRDELRVVGRTPGIVGRS